MKWEREGAEPIVRRSKSSNCQQNETMANKIRIKRLTGSGSRGHKLGESVRDRPVRL